MAEWRSSILGRHQPRTEEPQLPSCLSGADGFSFFRLLLGSLDIACLNCFPGVLPKPIGVVDEQQKRCKVGPATRAHRRATEARLADGALGGFTVSDQRPSTKNSSSPNSALAFLSAPASFDRIAAWILSCNSISSSRSSKCSVPSSRCDCSTRSCASFTISRASGKSAQA